jgi:hypothetical protein
MYPATLIPDRPILVGTSSTTTRRRHVCSDIAVIHTSSARLAKVGLSILFALAVTAPVLAGCGGARKQGATGHGRQPAPHPPSRILARLSSAAQGAGVLGAIRMTHSDVGGLWSLNAVTGRKWLCLALDVPDTLIGSSCATQTQIKKEHILIYPGAKPEKHGGGAIAYVVYGVVSPSVSALTVGLSDCTGLRVSLKTRPLFWVFVPHTKLANRIVPIRFTAVANSRAIRARLGPLGGSPRGQCAPRGN